MRPLRNVRPETPFPRKRHERSLQEGAQRRLPADRQELLKRLGEGVGYDAPRGSRLAPDLPANSGDGECPEKVQRVEDHVR